MAAGGLSGEISEADKGKYLEPPEWYKELVANIDSLMTVDPSTAVNVVLPKIAQTVADQLYLILPITHPCRPP